MPPNAAGPWVTGDEEGNGRAPSQPAPPSCSCSGRGGTAQECRRAGTCRGWHRQRSRDLAPSPSHAGSSAEPHEGITAVANPGWGLLHQEGWQEAGGGSEPPEPPRSEGQAPHSVPEHPTACRGTPQPSSPLLLWQPLFWGGDLKAALLNVLCLGKAASCQ